LVEWKKKISAKLSDPASCLPKMLHFLPGLMDQLDRDKEWSWRGSEVIIANTYINTLYIKYCSTYFVLANNGTDRFQFLLHP
jgi:hypothetical protein